MSALLWKFKGALAVAVLCMALAGMAAVAIAKRDAALVESGRVATLNALADSTLAVRDAQLAAANAARDSAATAAKRAEVRAQRTHATIRTQLDTLHDTLTISVPEVRTIVETVIAADSVALNAAHAETVAADSIAKLERAAKLVWKDKYELHAPRVVANTHKWRHRAERALLIALATKVTIDAVKK